ncbi:ciliogenesis-associated TTC17-interacting protein [Melanotaenia boesemani]|uniref:ciliogenesis-associated TTC17-interacting protein n=1 Tax=Melanotaenia boesemani TaxID=1250792 RepID=UPI001C05AC65|nr:ciliogenesis-associated TTC17-interacting protein [Melanotaenia boesemani]
MKVALMAEVPPDDDTSSGAVAVTEETKHEQLASDEAVTFISDIEPVELQKCVFAESLIMVSEDGRDLGEFNVKVEFASRVQQPCILVHSQSQGSTDGFPFGITVTAYLTVDLEVLEEDYYEYLKLEDHTVEKRCHMVKHDGQMEINKVTTVGEEVTEESASYPMSALRGLVTEGSHFLLMRLIALRRKVPEHMVFVSLDQQLKMIHIIFSELGLKQLEVGSEVLEVFGVQRIVHCADNSPTIWQCYFLDDGRLASRMQVGSPLIMRLLQLPSEIDKGFKKNSLVLEEDMQLHSHFLDRKDELKADHALYLRQHPEIRALISDFLQSLLLRKPDDVLLFAKKYFLCFAPSSPPETNRNTHLP